MEEVTENVQTIQEWIFGTGRVRGGRPEPAPLPREAVNLLRRAGQAADSLLHQHRLEDDVKDASLGGSYPAEFPHPGPAWAELSNLSWAIEAYLEKMNEGNVWNGEPEVKDVPE